MFRISMFSLFLSVVCYLMVTAPCANAQERYGMEFGVGMMVTVNDDRDLLRLDTFTYEVWLKDLEGTTGAWRRVFHKGLNNVNTGRGPLLSLRPNDAGMHFSHSTGTGQQTANSIGGLTTNEWAHVALVLTALNGEEIIYQDGVEAARTGGLNLTNSTQEASLHIGMANSASVVLDDFRIWNYPRTEEEIQAGMGQELIGDEPGLVAYWKFDEGGGDTVFDSSASGLHGEVAGAMWTTDIAPIEPARPPTFAFAAMPDNGADNVQHKVVLSWQPGIYAETHNVYLGTAFDDVNDADVANPAGALVSQGQTDLSLDLGALQFGQTYYWRVDEVNSAPDNTIFKGDIWSFTVEPISIPITPLTVAASSTFGVSGPEKTMDGSGLADDLHGTAAGDMWISGSVPATIEYAFDRAYKMHELWIWNSNQTIEPFIGFGGKDVVIEHSLDGTTWTALEGIGPLAQAPGTDGYAVNNRIDFGGATAQHVRITINSVQGFAPQASLSEVRFHYIPTFATGPNPASGAAGVAPDVTLSWGRTGREAASHEVHLGTEPNSVTLAGSVAENSFVTLASDLKLGQTYYWRVDEVNDAEDPSTWMGDIWSFSTVDAIVVDDMEGYADQEFQEIWASWVDGFADPANGSLVGNGVAGTPENTITYGGAQSLPLHYDNSAAAASEATRTFAGSRDWTKHGVQSLVLFFQGSSANTGGQLYVKVNDTKIAYHGAASDLIGLGWNKWTIHVAEMGAAAERVSSLTIGVEGGGSGTVYVDEIQLTTGERSLATPTEPSEEGLVARYAFDGDTSDSTGNNPGTLFGNGVFVPGVDGQALNLDGVISYVAIDNLFYQANDITEVSVTAWIRTQEEGNQIIASFDRNEYWRFQVNGDGGGPGQIGWSVWTSSGQLDYGSTTRVDDGEWHLVVGVFDNGTATIYIDGHAERPATGGSLLGTGNLRYGFVGTGSEATAFDGAQTAQYFIGDLDDVRIYHRALSAAEVAGMAGRTDPFELP